MTPTLRSSGCPLKILLRTWHIFGPKNGGLEVLRRLVSFSRGATFMHLQYSVMLRLSEEKLQCNCATSIFPRSTDKYRFKRLCGRLCGISQGILHLIKLLASDVAISIQVKIFKGIGLVSRIRFIRFRIDKRAALSRKGRPGRSIPHFFFYKCRLTSLSTKSQPVKKPTVCRR